MDWHDAMPTVACLIAQSMAQIWSISVSLPLMFTGKTFYSHRVCFTAQYRKESTYKTPYLCMNICHSGRRLVLAFQRLELQVLDQVHKLHATCTLLCLHGQTLNRHECSGKLSVLQLPWS